MKAPALFDPKLGTVHVWSKDGRIPAVLADMIDGNVNRVAKRHTTDLGAATDESRFAFNWTDQAYGRFYVTTAGDTRATQLAANLVGAREGVTCLPTKKSPGAGQWLREQIGRRVKAGLDVTIVVRGGAW